MCQAVLFDSRRQRCSMAKSKNGALMEHFAFYASYHSNPINQLIHVVVSQG